MQAKLRAFLDAVHGRKWARIVPLILMAALYVASMIAWTPADPADWIKPLLLDAVITGAVYCINRFSSGSEGFSNLAVLFFSFDGVLATLMLLSLNPPLFRGPFNAGLGIGPAMFLGISLYHRYRMKKGR